MVDACIRFVHLSNIIPLIDTKTYNTTYWRDNSISHLLLKLLIILPIQIEKTTSPKSHFSDVMQLVTIFI